MTKGRFLLFHWLLVLSKYTLVPDDKRAFLIIPLAAGTVKVHLIGETGPDTYTISETEVSAYMGSPMPYLIDKVFVDGTTAQFNIGL
jgi:hypothetical protein